MKNLQAARTALQAKFANIGPAHFYRCSDSDWYDVRNILQSLSVSFINSGAKPFLCSLSHYQVQAILDFLDQMQWAFIHPRSTSLRQFVAHQSTANPLTK